MDRLIFAIEAIIASFGPLWTFVALFQKKEWRTLWGFFNPGCGAQIAVCVSDTFIKENKRWTVIGPAREGVLECRFKNGERSRFLYIKITDNSTEPA